MKHEDDLADELPHQVLSPILSLVHLAISPKEKIPCSGLLRRLPMVLFLSLQEAMSRHYYSEQEAKNSICSDMTASYKSPYIKTMRSLLPKGTPPALSVLSLLPAASIYNEHSDYHLRYLVLSAEQISTQQMIWMKTISMMTSSFSEMCKASTD